MSSKFMKVVSFGLLGGQKKEKQPDVVMPKPAPIIEQNKKKEDELSKRKRKRRIGAQSTRSTLLTGAQGLTGAPISLLKQKLGE